MKYYYQSVKYQGRTQDFFYIKTENNVKGKIRVFKSRFGHVVSEDTLDNIVNKKGKRSTRDARAYPGKFDVI